MMYNNIIKLSITSGKMNDLAPLPSFGHVSESVQMRIRRDVNPFGARFASLLSKTSQPFQLELVALKITTFKKKKKKTLETGNQQVYIIQATVRLWIIDQFLEFGQVELGLADFCWSFSGDGIQDDNFKKAKLSLEQRAGTHPGVLRRKNSRSRDVWEICRN